MPTTSLAARVLNLLGIESHPVSHHERWLSMAGGVIGIALVFTAMDLGPPGMAHGLVVASMGASAVLVFGVPHGALSQPWPVVGGHLVSALIGVTMARFVGDPLLAGPLAVGLAILAMHYARCLHPPGGATALAAVIGGDAVTALGYGYVLAPVLENVLLLSAAGFLFNFPFRWRRWPAALVRAPVTAPPPAPVAGAGPTLEHADLVYALTEIDSFIDVSEGDLLRIYDLATRHAEGEPLPADRIRAGCCYSNGRFGADWAVRCIVDVSEDQKQVIYRGVAGADRRRSGTLSRADFARWARYRVERDETTWRPVGSVRGDEGGLI
jgi:CBS-domain-containing membrane protein